MTRASALNMREQIRVSKNAIKSGVVFADYGQTLLREFLKFDYVKSAEIYFVTDFDEFEKLDSVAKKISQTTSALNHIFDNVMFDCSTCNLKEICDLENYLNLPQPTLKKGMILRGNHYLCSSGVINKTDEFSTVLPMSVPTSRCYQ